MSALTARDACVLPLLLLLLGACAGAAGFDPAKPTFDPVSAAADSEVEPLPPSPKRKMRDPRGAAVLEAGAPVGSAAPDAPVASAAPVATCGSKAAPCPMQRFMRGAMATAHTPDTLTSAFTRVAGMSPDPAWRWVAIATRGAELANAGDIAGAKAQCKVCHEAYEELYRSRHRTRQL